MDGCDVGGLDGSLLARLAQGDSDSDSDSDLSALSVWSCRSKDYKE